VATFISVLTVVRYGPIASDTGPAVTRGAAG
jgi:hypothetical protein